MVEHGYEAMTLRQLAEAVGIQAGSVYRYFGAKDKLLAEIMIGHMETVLATLRDRLEGIAGPAARLAAFCDFHIRYHIEKQPEVFLATMEIRSLVDEARSRVLALRQAYETEVVSIVADGVAAGVFADRDPRVTAFAIIGMLTSVCQWYRPTGRLGPDEIIALHRDLVMAGVRA
jgi:AcrR family transcriptional regulator